jgi:hypothetical protein
MLMETKINAKCKKTLFVLKRGVMVNGEWSMVNGEWSMVNGESSVILMPLLVF